MRGIQGEIEALGASLIFVGNGSRDMATGFKEDFSVEAPIYVDPSLRAYAAFGMTRKLSLGMGTLKAAARAMMNGFRQGRTQGDAPQLCGVYIVGTDGAIRFAYPSRFAGDHPSPDVILKALR